VCNASGGSSRTAKQNQAEESLTGGRLAKRTMDCGGERGEAEFAFFPRNVTIQHRKVMKRILVINLRAWPSGLRF
jgi:hypothetical protein